jgi:DNA-binding FrmR family transcriptional regulator
MKKSTPDPGRKAHGVDPDARTRNLNRLRRIEGQVRGIAKMVEDDRYCIDVLDQVAAVEKALRAVSAELVKNHLRHCVRHALDGHGDPDAVIEELSDVLTR